MKIEDNHSNHGRRDSCQKVLHPRPFLEPRILM